jgi:hypothetical protein
MKVLRWCWGAVSDLFNTLFPSAAWIEERERWLEEERRKHEGD